VTPKELETLRLVAQGLTYQQIAGKLNLSLGAVNHRMRWARKKLGAISNENAIYIACKKGLL
jgi:DNA-binding CsgD family transcriptional regulator